jgi:hypothetical protein
MTKLIFAFRSIAIAPNKRVVNAERVDYYNGSRMQQRVGVVVKHARFQYNTRLCIGALPFVLLSVYVSVFMYVPYVVCV